MNGKTIYLYIRAIERYFCGSISLQSIEMESSLEKSEFECAVDRIQEDIKSFTTMYNTYVVNDGKTNFGAENAIAKASKVCLDYLFNKFDSICAKIRAYEEYNETISSDLSKNLLDAVISIENDMEAQHSKLQNVLDTSSSQFSYVLKAQKQIMVNGILGLTSSFKDNIDQLQDVVDVTVKDAISSYKSTVESQLQSMNSLFDSLLSDYDSKRKENNKQVNDELSSVDFDTKYKELSSVLEDYKSTCCTISDKLKKTMESLRRTDKMPLFICNNSDQEYCIDMELLSRNKGTYFYDLFMDAERRNIQGNIFVDHDGTNMDYVLQYLNGDSIDYDQLSDETKKELRKDFSFFRVPFKTEVSRLYVDSDIKKIDAWKSKVILFNDTMDEELMAYVQQNCKDTILLRDIQIKDIQYNEETNKITVSTTWKYLDLIRDYFLKNEIVPKKLMDCHCSVSALQNELKYFNPDITESDIRSKVRQECTYLTESTIIDALDEVHLREWLGNDREWKLIYRASEHDYTAQSFHEFCDNQGSTLVIIKSSEGWIFGGYTTQSWSGNGIHYDMI